MRPHGLVANNNEIVLHVDFLPGALTVVIPGAEVSVGEQGSELCRVLFYIQMEKKPNSNEKRRE